jgi:peroxiredoxin
MWRTWRDRGVRVWGIASQEDRAVVQLFADQYGLTFPILLDQNGQVNRAYHQDVAFPSAAYPQDWVIGTDGRIAYVNNGFELDAMETVLENELAETR